MQPSGENSKQIYARDCPAIVTYVGQYKGCPSTVLEQE